MKARLICALLLGLSACQSRKERELPMEIHQVWVNGHRSLCLDPTFIPYDPPRDFDKMAILRPGSAFVPMTWLHVLQTNDAEWAFGIPDHPAMSLLDIHQTSLQPPELQGIVRRHDPIWAQLTQFIFRKDALGRWQRVGEYHPADDNHHPLGNPDVCPPQPSLLQPFKPHGFLFVARNEAWFIDGSQASPCARYRLNESGRLEFQNLIDLFEGAPGITWRDWEGDLNCAISPKALAISSRFGGYISVRDPNDGHLLHLVQLPGARDGQRYRSVSVQPAPDGSFFITAGKGDKGDDAWDVRRTPGGELAAARLGLISEDLAIQPVAFHLDPITGEIAEVPLPMGVPHSLSHAEFNYSYTFLVDAAGQLELHRRPMR